MPWTIDILLDYSSYSGVTKLSTNWNCPGKWCQRLCSSWICLDYWFRRLSVNWICSGICLRGLSINWNCLNNWCLVLQLNRIIQTNDLGDCLLIGIVLRIVLTSCLLLGIAWTVYFGWFTWIEVVETTVGTTAFGYRLLIGIIRTIEFQRALILQTRQLLLWKVQYHAVITSLTGWGGSMYTQSFGRTCCNVLCYE